RTEAALEGVPPDPVVRQKILGQSRLPDQFLLNFSGGNSFRLHLKNRPGAAEKILSLYISVRNLLNKSNLMTGGFEQLRFDTGEKNPEKFPPKYFFGQGINYSIHLRLRIL
ncbi:MAG TPA: hypothetical protein VG842_09410, partial [Sediminibacterium sp.]|nr:hypothetical protein [Sediminibacterium sp.]